SLALVRRIRLRRTGGSYQGLDRPGVSGRRGVSLPSDHGRLASLAGIPPVFRALAVSSDCCSLAYSRGTQEHRRPEWPRLLLVLLRHRTLPAVLGQAVAARLQQVALGSLLVAAPCLAFPVEPLSSRCDPHDDGSPQEFAEGRFREP